MTRAEFTEKICRLILKMRSEGEDPILDYIKRSDEEQKRLFIAGESKCDGTTKVSEHQRGRAGDIYFLDMYNKGRIAIPIKGHAYWHKVWEEMGGKPMIMWDRGHFEG